MIRSLFHRREWSPAGAIYAPVWTVRPWVSDTIRVAIALLILIAVS